jgi:hypothetical protein
MDIVRNKNIVILSVFLLVGVFSAVATRSIITGIGVSLIIFISWEMWRYIKEISK